MFSFWDFLCFDKIRRVLTWLVNLYRPVYEAPLAKGRHSSSEGGSRAARLEKVREKGGNRSGGEKGEMRLRGRNMTLLIVPQCHPWATAGWEAF